MSFTVGVIPYITGLHFRIAVGYVQRCSGFQRQIIITGLGLVIKHFIGWAIQFIFIGNIVFDPIVATTLFNDRRGCAIISRGRWVAVGGCQYSFIQQVPVFYKHFILVIVGCWLYLNTCPGRFGTFWRYGRNSFFQCFMVFCNNGRFIYRLVQK